MRAQPTLVPPTDGVPLNPGKQPSLGSRVGRARAQTQRKHRIQLAAFVQKRLRCGTKFPPTSLELRQFIRVERADNGKSGQVLEFLKMHRFSLF